LFSESCTAAALAAAVRQDVAADRVAMDVPSDTAVVRDASADVTPDAAPADSAFASDASDAIADAAPDAGTDASPDAAADGASGTLWTDHPCGTTAPAPSPVSGVSYVTNLGLQGGGPVGRTANRVLGVQFINNPDSSRWSLWDPSSRTEVARGRETFPTASPGCSLPRRLAVAGDVFAGPDSSCGITLRSMTDGSVLGTVAAPNSEAVSLAPDGSYLVGVSSTALRVWSRDGTSRWSQSAALSRWLRNADVRRQRYPARGNELVGS
jgi:hypothetical protein